MKKPKTWLVLNTSYTERYKFSKELFFSLIVVSLVFRGASINSGLSTDDYMFLEEESFDLNHFLFQDRLFSALVFWALQQIGISVTGQVAVFSLATIITQSLLITLISGILFSKISIFNKFIGGALALSHPYWSELYTFKSFLVLIVFTLVFLIVALMILSKENSKNERLWYVATVPILMALLTYQSVMNYLILIILFGGLISEYYRRVDPFESVKLRQFTRKTTICSLIAIFLYLIVTKIFANIANLPSDRRSELISMADAPNRAETALSQIAKIFLLQDPMIPLSAKLVYFMALSLSVFMFISSTLKLNPPKSNLKIFMLFAALPFATIGVILTTQEWWPTPRSTQQVGLVFGLIFMLAALTNDRKLSQKVITTFALLSIFLGIGLNNQIFTDQRRINDLDSVTSLRIFTQFEEDDGYDSIETIVFGGRFYTYPLGVRTAYMDLNISAFGAPWSQLRLFEKVTGMQFREANDSERLQGLEFCSTAPTWPSIKSTQIIGKVGVICLSK